MRRAPRSNPVSGTLYRNVALIALAAAVVVALANGDGPEPAVPSAAQRRVWAPPVPQQRQAGPDAGPDAGRAEYSADDRAAPEDTDGDAAAPAPPATPMPQAAATRAATGVKPTPEQLRQLIDDSRRRSGAHPGGD